MQAIFTNRFSTIKLIVLTPLCSGSGVVVGISAEYTMYNRINKLGNQSLFRSTRQTIYQHQTQK